jgi:hypothetical protein
MGKFREWLWERVEYPLAIGLIKIGADQKIWLWNLVYSISPAIAGTVILLADTFKSRHGMDWILGDGQPNEQADVPAEIISDVSEMINRAPTPFGNDNYWICISRLGALPGDVEGMSFQRLDATRDERSLVSFHLLRGNRWRDWKNGAGPQAAYDLLEQTRPVTEAPVTVIQVGVTGRAIASLLMPG